MFEVKVIEGVDVAFVFWRKLHVSVAETSQQVFMSFRRTIELPSLKLIKSGFAEHFFRDDGFRMVVVEANLLTVFERIFQQDATYLRLDALHREDLSAEQREPRRRSVTMAIRVAVCQIENLEIEVVMVFVEELPDGIVGDAVDGHDVEVDAAEIVIMATFNERGTSILNLSEGHWIQRVVLATNEFQMFRQPLTPVCDETFVVWSRHSEVYVIVPRDEAFMAHSTEHGAVGHVVAQTVFATDAVEVY